MYDYTCGKCGGLVAEPMKPYGYAGRFCHCENPTLPKEGSTATTTSSTDRMFMQVCTCGQKCPIHDINN